MTEATQHFKFLIQFQIFGSTQNKEKSYMQFKCI